MLMSCSCAMACTDCPTRPHTHLMTHSGLSQVVSAWQIVTAHGPYVTREGVSEEGGRREHSIAAASTLHWHKSTTTFVTQTTPLHRPLLHRYHSTKWCHSAGNTQKTRQVRTHTEIHGYTYTCIQAHTSTITWCMHVRRDDADSCDLVHFLPQFLTLVAETVLLFSLLTQLLSQVIAGCYGNKEGKDSMYHIAQDSTVEGNKSGTHTTCTLLMSSPLSAAHLSTSRFFSVFSACSLLSSSPIFS